MSCFSGVCLGVSIVICLLAGCADTAPGTLVRAQQLLIIINTRPVVLNPGGSVPSYPHPHQGTFGNVWSYFELSQLETQYQFLGGRGQNMAKHATVPRTIPQQNVKSARVQDPTLDCMLQENSNHIVVYSQLYLQHLTAHGPYSKCSLNTAPVCKLTK